MAVNLRSIYYDTKEKYKLNLIAGEKGLDNVVSWVHFMEDITTMDFIKGSDLIITTGMGNNSEEWLLELIKGLSDREESGLIVNTGMYINNISYKAIEYCNKAGFPLFTMPWEIHLVDIMQDYCNRIFMANQNELNENAAFLSAIFSPETIEKHKEYFLQNEYDVDGSYCVFIIDLNENDLLEEEKKHVLKKLKIAIMNISNRLFIKYSIAEHNKSLLIIIHNIGNEDIVKYAEKLNEVCKRRYYEYNIKISAGSRVKNISNLFKSFKHALVAQKMILNNNDSLSIYENLGVNKLIFDISDKDTLINFYRDMLGALEEYDKKHNTEFLYTLKLYIDNDCSIQAVADLIFTHRNTINYRIKKIKSILNNEINTMNDKFNYKMAFCIKDILEMY